MTDVGGKTTEKNVSQNPSLSTEQTALKQKTDDHKTSEKKSNKAEKTDLLDPKPKTAQPKIKVMASKVEKRDSTAPQLTTKASALEEERSIKETPSKKIMTSKKASQQSEGQKVPEFEKTPTKNTKN